MFIVLWLCSRVIEGFCIFSDGREILCISSGKGLSVKVICCIVVIWFEDVNVVGLFRCRFFVCKCGYGI